MPMAQGLHSAIMMSSHGWSQTSLAWGKKTPSSTVCVEKKKFDMEFYFMTWRTQTSKQCD
jgi:hypothetical protein